MFVDYVRMVRGHKSVDWSRYLAAEDRAYLEQTIEPQAWYPMETFERLGVGIVREVAGGQLAAVHMWGRFQVAAVHKAFPTLVAAGDPRETLMRFHALHRAFFDYDAVQVMEALDDSAMVAIQYGMSAEAEEAACHQSLGFFEALVETAGAIGVRGEFVARGWKGDERTILAVHWTMP